VAGADCFVVYRNKVFGYGAVKLLVSIGRWCATQEDQIEARSKYKSGMLPPHQPAWRTCDMKEIIIIFPLIAKVGDKSSPYA
jgi:hypothetical protein